MEHATLYIVLNALAVFNILVICAFLLIRKNNSLPNRLLAVIFAIPGLYLVDNLFIYTERIHSYPYFFFFVQIIANLFPIAVYIYVHLLIGRPKRIKPILILSSTTGFLFSLALLVHVSMLPPADLAQYLRQLSSDDYPASMKLYNVVFYVCQMIYLAVLFVEVKAYRELVKSQLSAIESVKILFVWQFIELLALLNFMLVLLYLLLPTSVVDYGLLPVVVTVIYLFVIVFSIKNNVIFSHETYAALRLENQRILAHPQGKKEAADADKAAAWTETIAVLERLMKQDKVFRMNTLSLTSLAEMAEEQPYILSQILNQHFHKSFFDFINEARVEEAKVLLKSFDTKVDKIENIAEEVGFNSRASFYRSFKKITGKSPYDFVSLP